MKKFVISVDSCVDRFKSFLQQNDVFCICLKRCTDGVETAELFENFEQMEKFFEQLKSGAMPTTSQLNPSEVFDYFSEIVSKKEGDIIHLCLSSGLSNTYDNCVLAAKQIKETFNRNVYVFDTLSASFGIAMQLDRLIELREQGKNATEALENLKNLRDNQQVWVSVGDLFHLKRGGRISGFKATVGTVLNIRPILVINNVGKLSIEKNIKGTKKSLHYLLEKLSELGNFHEKHSHGKKSHQHENADQTQPKIYLAHSSASKEMEILKKSLKSHFPHHQIHEGMIGSIIGSHLGSGAVAIIFEGKQRLEI